MIRHKNRRPYDDLYYCISELRNGTLYSSPSQTRDSQNTIKRLPLSVFECYNDCIIKFAFVRLIKK